MILGIDVGGTHTDAVLIENLDVKRKTKVPTDEKNLLNSLLAVTTDLLKDEQPEKLERVVLSTTLSTNAIVQKKTDRVGMILISGPGLPPSLLPVQQDSIHIRGYSNHRGAEMAAIDPGEVGEASRRFQENKIQHIGVVGKFSTRNPKQEGTVRDLLEGSFQHVSMGHRLSGHLNFPRRIATTYLNESIWRRYNTFISQIQGFVRDQGINVPIYILKADGGTFDIEHSREFPVQTILSGPAASIMGILSMARCRRDAVALDIGGTTTDIALFADGVPLLEPFGVTIEGHKTLIRGLKTRSIGLGGDSRICVTDGGLQIGPVREGPAYACGGPCPTPTDAMIVLGLTGIGDASLARKAMEDVGRQMGMGIEDTARTVHEETCRIISAAVTSMIEEVNNKPVYTIHEMLEGKKLVPKTLFVVGGPAEPIAPRLAELLGIPAQIPEHAEVANAIGAALARTTAEMTLLADTEQRILTIAEDGYQESIPARFTKADAIRIGQDRLREKVKGMGAREEDLEIEVIEDMEFNMVKQFYTTGKNIRVKVQVKPGLIAGLTAGGKP